MPAFNQLPPPIFSATSSEWTRRINHNGLVVLIQLRQPSYHSEPDDPDLVPSTIEFATPGRPPVTPSTSSNA